MPESSWPRIDVQKGQKRAKAARIYLCCRGSCVQQGGYGGVFGWGIRELLYCLFCRTCDVLSMAYDPYVLRRTNEQNYQYLPSSAPEIYGIFHMENDARCPRLFFAAFTILALLNWRERHILTVFRYFHQRRYWMRSCIIYSLLYVALDWPPYFKEEAKCEI